MSTEVVCTLTDEEFRARERGVISKLMPLIIERFETETGYRFVFPFSEETLDSVFEFIRLERECCRFLDFRLELGDTKGLSLELSGLPGAKEFIASTFQMKKREP